MFQKHCKCLCGGVEADSDRKCNALLLSWHIPVNDSTECKIVVQLGDLED